MPNISLSFTVDANLKREADAVCSQLGLPLDAALRMFLYQLVAQQRLPFVVPTPGQASDLPELPLSRRAKKRLWQIIDAGDPDAQEKIARLLALRNRWDVREGGPAAEFPSASPHSPVIGTDS